MDESNFIDTYDPAPIGMEEVQQPDQKIAAIENIIVRPDLMDQKTTFAYIP